MKPDHLSKRGLPAHIKGAGIHNPQRCWVCGASHGRNVRAGVYGDQWLAGDSPNRGSVKPGNRGDRRRREIAEQMDAEVGNE